MNKDKLQYLSGLIELLSKDDKFILVVFMLRCQLVEYGIKHMYNMHPNTTANIFLDRVTLGEAIGKLEGLKDSYLQDIVEKARSFNKLRGYVMHQFLTSDIKIEELESDLRDKMKTASQLEGQISHLIYFIVDTYYNGYGQQERELLGL